MKYDDFASYDGLCRELSFLHSGQWVLIDWNHTCSPAFQGPKKVRVFPSYHDLVTYIIRNDLIEDPDIPICDRRIGGLSYYVYCSPPAQIGGIRYTEWSVADMFPIERLLNKNREKVHAREIRPAH